MNFPLKPTATTTVPVLLYAFSKLVSASNAVEAGTAVYQATVLIKLESVV